MVSVADKKARLLEEIGLEVRLMSAQSTLLSAAIAERVGLSSSDLECLDLIVMRQGQMTPGELASASGLTTGAVTGLLDRLERRGYAKREPDPNDRRKIRIRAVDQQLAEIGQLYAHLQAATTQLWSQFSVQQLKTIHQFLSASTQLVSGEIERARTLPKSAKSKVSARKTG